MSRTRNLLFAILLAALLLIAIKILIKPSDPLLNHSPGDLAAETGSPVLRETPLPSSSPTSEGDDSSPAISLQDGPEIIEQHCTQCHLAELLYQQSQSRLDWEMVLTRMEKMGSLLSSDEKVILIDYLTGITTP